MVFYQIILVFIKVISTKYKHHHKFPSSSQALLLRLFLLTFIGHFNNLQRLAKLVYIYLLNPKGFQLVMVLAQRRCHGLWQLYPWKAISTHTKWGFLCTIILFFLSTQLFFPFQAHVYKIYYIMASIGDRSLLWWFIYNRIILNIIQYVRCFIYYHLFPFIHGLSAKSKRIASPIDIRKPISICFPFSM